MQFILVALGGALGAVARFGVGQFAQNNIASPFPLGALLSNIFGCFIAGLLFVWAAEIKENDTLTLLLITGFCGGFTTFSAFSLEFFHLIRQEQIALAAAYFAASLCLSLASCFAGLWLARSIL